MAEVPSSRYSEVDSFSLADLGDTVALYDRRSGRTHLLAALTAEVLRMVVARHPAPCSASSIRDSLAIDIGMSPEELPTAAVEDAIEQLRSAELLT